MIYSFRGPFLYSKAIIESLDSNIIGVYYCGTKTDDNKLTAISYIGKGTGDGGIRSRLLDHFNNDNWSDVTHFGYEKCDTAKEAEDHEADEIKRYQPKHNVLGK